MHLALHFGRAGMNLDRAPHVLKSGVERVSSWNEACLAGRVRLVRRKSINEESFLSLMSSSATDQIGDIYPAHWLPPITESLNATVLTT